MTILIYYFRAINKNMTASSYLNLLFGQVDLEESTIFEIVFNYDICDGIKYKLDIVGVSGTGEVCVDFFCIFTFIKVLEL